MSSSLPSGAESQCAVPKMSKMAQASHDCSLRKAWSMALLAPVRQLCRNLGAIRLQFVGLLATCRAVQQRRRASANVCPWKARPHCSRASRSSCSLPEEAIFLPSIHRNQKMALLWRTREKYLICTSCWRSWTSRPHRTQTKCRISDGRGLRSGQIRAFLNTKPANRGQAKAGETALELLGQAARRRGWDSLIQLLPSCHLAGRRGSTAALQGGPAPRSFRSQFNGLTAQPLNRSAALPFTGV